MDLGISGKTALVMGASRGIGKGIAKALAAEGVNLLLLARNEHRLQALAAELNDTCKVHVDWIAMDLGSSDSLQQLKAFIQQRSLHIDIFVCITGGPLPGAALDTPIDTYKTQFDLMITPSIEMTRYLVQGMIDKGWGRVVTVTSSGVIEPIEHLVVSNTLRSGLVNWNKTLANEVAQFGVTVNILIPGKIKTERLDEIDQAKSQRSGMPVEQVVKNSQSAIPMNRYGTVEEFAAAASFLVSQQASYITGSCVRVDGGLVSSV